MKKANELNLELNRIWKQQDQLYQSYATRWGLSTVAFWIIYSLYQTGEEVYTQNDLAEMWYTPKQTINSAISSLVKMGYICLEPIKSARNSKSVKLTPQGEEICEKIISPLFKAEVNALLKMSPQERATFIELFDKQQTLLEQEFDLIYKDKDMDFSLKGKENV